MLVTVQAFAGKSTELKTGGCFSRDGVTEELNHEGTEAAQWHGEVQGGRQQDPALMSTREDETCCHCCQKE